MDYQNKAISNIDKKKVSNIFLCHGCGNHSLVYEGEDSAYRACGCGEIMKPVGHCEVVAHE